MAEAASKEPSMEEILASIRRIIADENEAGNATSEDAANEDNSAASDVLEQGIATQPEPAASAQPSPPEVEIASQLRPAIDQQPSQVVEPTQTPAPQSPVVGMPSAEPVVAKAEPQPTATPEPSAQGMSLANIAANLKRPGESNSASSPDPVSKPAPTPATSSDVATASEPQTQPVSKPTPDVVKVNLANPNPVPAQVMNEVAKRTETAQKPSAEASEFRNALMSSETKAEVSGSFEELKKLRADEAMPSALAEQTEQMLRPMLKEWLDENLPTLVERLVREEIERVARG